MSTISLTNRLFVMLGVVLFGAAGAAGVSAQETPTPEPFLPAWISPTPDETGALIVIVQPGESLWAIAARAGLTLPEILALNNLTENSVINPGDALIIGYSTPEATATLVVESTATATRPPPTPRPTQPRPEATVCLSAFTDTNQNGVLDPGEPLQAGVAFTLYNTEAVVANYITDGLSEPKCLEGLVPGEYRVTRSILPGEILTTPGDWSLNIAADRQLYQAFGSVMAGAAATSEPTRDAAALDVAPSGGPPSGEAPPDRVSPAMTSPASRPAPVTPTPESSNTSPDAADGALTRRMIGVIALFIIGLTLLLVVLILLFRQARGRESAANTQANTGTERRFKNIDDLD